MWQPSHYFTIPFSLLGIALLAVGSRRLPPRIRHRTGQVLWIILLLSEVLKQWEGYRTGDYSPLYYPVHYSSTFYLSLGLYCFGGKEARHYGACTLYVGGALLLLTLCYNPTGVVGDTALLLQSHFALHSYVYHMGILLFFAVMLANFSYRVRPFDVLRYASFLLGWGCVALPIARITDVNYAGLLQSWIPILESLRAVVGDGWYLLAYGTLILTLAALLIQIYARLCPPQQEEAVLI